ncbi:hypothetical protein BDR06DRAFT_975591 [Suillus hirtellus]|nr:hypothetical protein BDR06DRAFT_975591 [Suillus hirtellus]
MEAFYVGIFVDQDMFMCYTHYGIGHPIVLRQLTRDCANAELVDNPGLEEHENDDDEWESDSQPHRSVGGDEGGQEDDSGEDEEQECDDDEESSIQDDEEMEVGEDMDEDEEVDKHNDILLF